MLSDIGTHMKPQLQSLCSFMQISLYNILLARTSSKIALPWSHLHYELSTFPTIIVVILHLKKVFLCKQKDVP